MTSDFCSTHRIDGFPGGVQSIDFSYRSNKIAIGSSGGFVGSFRLKVTEAI